MPINSNNNILDNFVGIQDFNFLLLKKIDTLNNNNIIEVKIPGSLLERYFTELEIFIVKNILSRSDIHKIILHVASSGIYHTNLFRESEYAHDSSKGILLYRFLEKIKERESLVYDYSLKGFVNQTMGNTQRRYVGFTSLVFHSAQGLAYGFIDWNGVEGNFIKDYWGWVYSHTDGIYFRTEEVAEANGYYYCERCDDYTREEQDSGCSICYDGADEDGSTYDNKFNLVYTKKESNFLKYTKTSNMQYTFGVEMETSKGYAWLNHDLSLACVEDGSISGLEYVTGVLQGNKGIAQLKSICGHLYYQDVKVDSKCGLHIHIGGANFNRRFSIILLKLCLDIQKDIYSLLPKSRQVNSYCKLLPENDINILNFRNYRDVLGKFICGKVLGKDYNKKKSHPGGRYNSYRYYWVNITNYSTKNGGDTVEFRCHSGTIDYDKIYKWLLICMSIVKYAENNIKRIYMSGLSKTKITLDEVLKYSLNKTDYKKIIEYCNKRKNKFKN
jgi:hypothetical protein